MNRDDEAPQRTAQHLPLSPRDFHILFALAESDCHGYGLVQAIEEQSGGTLQVDPANLYRALQKLVGSGLVADAERRPSEDADNERRRYYTITSLGRNVVACETERLRALTESEVGRRLLSEGQGRSE